MILGSIKVYGYNDFVDDKEVIFEVCSVHPTRKSPKSPIFISNNKIGYLSCIMMMILDLVLKGCSSENAMVYIRKNINKNIPKGTSLRENFRRFLIFHTIDDLYEKLKCPMCVEVSSSNITGK